MLNNTCISITITITECDIGTFGYDCMNNCSGHCLNNSSCNKETGHCDGGCNLGYTNGDCNKGISMQINLHTLLKNKYVFSFSKSKSLLTNTLMHLLTD